MPTALAEAEPAAPPVTATPCRCAGSPLSVEQLAERLGDIPLDRVRFDAAPGTATVADAIRITESDRPCELLDGVLVEKAMGFWESRVGVKLSSRLEAFVEDRRLGIVVGADGLVQVRPGQVRMPDVAFYTWDRLPPDRRDAAPAITPDLAVEVFSRGNTAREMQRKRAEYFAAGTRLVWIVDPATRTVAVYTPASPDAPAVLREGDALTGDPILPGFSLPVTELFAGPDRPEER